jgi:anthranilate phosphoribosyltransferase
MAGALSGLGIERGFVVHGAGGWDEPSPLGEFLLFDVTPGRVEESTRRPSDLGMSECRPEDLTGGSPAHNASRLLDVLRGERSPHRDAIVLGAALALEVTGRASSADEAAGLAAATVDDGRALALVEALAEFGAAEAAS